MSLQWQGMISRIYCQVKKAKCMSVYDYIICTLKNTDLSIITKRMLKKVSTNYKSWFHIRREHCWESRKSCTFLSTAILCSLGSAYVNVYTFKINLNRKNEQS